MRESDGLKPNTSLQLDARPFVLRERLDAMAFTRPIRAWKAADEYGDLFALFLSPVESSSDVIAVETALHLASPDLLRLRSCGVWRSHDGQSFLFQQTTLPQGGQLAGTLAQRACPNLLAFAENLVRRLADALQTLHGGGLCHSALSAESVFFIDAPYSDPVLGDFSAVAPYSVDLAREDCLALGWLLVKTLYPQAKTADMQAKRQTLEPILNFDPAFGRLNHLLAGLTLYDPEQRWGLNEINQFLAGEMPPVVYLSAAEARIKPIQINGVQLRKPADVAEYTQNPKAYDELIRQPEGYKKLLAWYESLTDEANSRSLDKMLQFYKQDGAAFVLTALQRKMLPLAPIVVGSSVFTPSPEQPLARQLSQFWSVVDAERANASIETIKQAVLAFEFAVWEIARLQNQPQPEAYQNLLEKLGHKPKPNFDGAATLFARLNDGLLLDIFWIIDPERGFRTTENQSLRELAAVQTYFSEKPERWNDKRLTVEKNKFLKQAELNNLLNGDFQTFTKAKDSENRQTAVELVDVEETADGALVRIRFKQWDKGRPFQLLTDIGLETTISNINPIKTAEAVERWLADVAAGRNTRVGFSYATLMAGHTGGVNGIDFSPDGQHLISASDDNTLKVWDATRGVVSRSFAGHERGVLTAVFHPSGLLMASAGRNNQLIIHEIFTGKKAGVCSGHSDRIVALDFSPDGETMASGGFDTTIRTWQTSKAKLKKTVKAHWSYVNALKFSPEGDRIVSVGKDLKIAVTAAQTGLEIAAGAAGPNAQTEARCVAFHPNGQEIVVGLSNGSIVFRDAEQLSELKTLNGHKHAVLCLAVSPDGKWLASGDASGLLIVWNLETGQNENYPSENGAEIRSVCISKQNSAVAAADAKGKIMIRPLPQEIAVFPVDWSLISTESLEELKENLKKLLGNRQQAHRLLLEQKALRKMPSFENVVEVQKGRLNPLLALQSEETTAPKPKTERNRAYDSGGERKTRAVTPIETSGGGVSGGGVSGGGSSGGGGGSRSMSDEAIIYSEKRRQNQNLVYTIIAALVLILIIAFVVIYNA